MEFTANDPRARSA